MAKKGSKRTVRNKPQSRPAVRVGGVLVDVIDELASLIELLRAVPAASRNEPDEIAAWAGLLKLRLDDARRLPSEHGLNDAPAAIANHAAWRLSRVRRLLDGLRCRLPANVS